MIRAPYLDEMSSPGPATGAQLASRPAAAGDNLDDLFDYDAGLDDVFADLEPPKTTTPTDTARRVLTDAGLGIDKEVEIVKKPRVPRVKLDEDRYFTEPLRCIF